MITITVASSDQQLREILALQRRYLASVVPAELHAREGFVFVEHTLELLKRMSAQAPQAIALSSNRVVGYCLSLPLSLQGEVPSLAPMFEQFGRCAYRGKPLSEYRYIVGGQVCVDREYRGQRLMARLYGQLRASVWGAFDLCVTEVATRNIVSVEAHEKMGFEVISTYADDRETWVIVAWDLTKGPAS